MHTCNYCNYSTDSLGNFNTHKKSKKHITNVQAENQTDNKPEKIKKYTKRIPKSKNINEKVLEVTNDNLNEKVPNKTIPDEKVVDEKVVDEKVVDEKVVDEKVVDEKVVDEKVVDEKVIDEKVVDEKVIDETVIDEKVDDKFELDQDTYKALHFVITLIHKYKANTLVEYLGDFVIKNYKKDRADQQSLWSVNLTTNDYFIKVSAGTSGWHLDKNGVRVIQITIDPLLKFVNESIDKYFKVFNDESICDDRSIVIEISNMINKNVLSQYILKYMSPHLFFTMDKVNM